MILDADLQDPPELVFDFLKKIGDGYEVVYGIRKKRKEGPAKVFMYNLFYKILTKISNYPIPRDSGDFCLMTRKVVNAMLRITEESLYLRGIRSWVGFKQIGIPYERKARAAGDPKYTIRKLFKLAYDGIFNFSILPIKFLTVSGATCVLFSFGYFVITVYRKYFVQDVPLGFTALLFTIILFGGVQLMSLGVLGEYIHRIFFQVKERPLYFISKKIIDGKEYDN
jgi:dolichol-phosphate mannosyltransferase